MQALVHDGRDALKRFDSSASVGFCYGRGITADDQTLSVAHPSVADAAANDYGISVKADRSQPVPKASSPRSSRPITN